MKNTEKKILEKAKIILKDLQGEIYNEKNIEKVNFNAEKEITGSKTMKLALWTIVIHEPIFNSSLFYIFLTRMQSRFLSEANIKYLKSKKMLTENMLESRTSKTRLR